MLRVRLLGRPSLERDGAPLDWPAGRRASELLAWLALHPGDHARADLAPAFWPDVLDESARASLRTALHELRTALGPEAAAHLTASRDRVGLDGDVWVDVREARRLLAEGHDAGAVALGDDLLRGMDAEWVHPAREEHRRAVADALGRLTDAAAGEGDHAAAVAHARRRVALDPLAEEPARRLMAVLAAGGDRAAAVAVFEDLRARMAREMRVVPSPVTRALADELRGGGPAPTSVGARDLRPGRRLADRLAERARRSFVGRQGERERLRAALVPVHAGPAVVMLHGPGGVGKSRLLGAVLADLGPAVRVMALDCRDVEPTPTGFAAALSEALGLPGHQDPVALADLVGAGAARTVLALDNYESFVLLDTWLRRTFLPLLPEDVVTLVVGRNAPAAAWLTDPGWQGLIETVRLGGLDEGAAVELLRMRGLDDEEAARANRFARGHPLALELAAAGGAGNRAPVPASGPSPETIGRLVEVVLAGLEPDLVQTVRAASTLRRVDEGLLRALRGDAAAPDAFDRLRDLPFCEHGSAGLLLHDVVRDAVARDLTHRDPARAAAYRRAAAAELASRPASGEDLWQATADRLFLVQNPSVRDAFFPPGAVEHVLEPAGPDDLEAIERIARAWDPPGACAWIPVWADRLPGALSVARREDGSVAGFSATTELTDDVVDLLGDPVGRAWLAHLDGDPVDPGERVLLIRRFLTADHGEAVCPVMAATFLDVKRLYMEMRPHLRRVYTVVVDSEAVAPVTRPLGFMPAGPAAVIGDTPYHPGMLDFGPRSVDGWLARLIDAESDAAAAGRPMAAAAV